MEDDQLAALAYLYLAENRLPDDCPPMRKRHIKRRAENMVVMDGQLFYKRSNGKVCES